MRILVPLLSTLFSALKAAAIVLASPLTLLCCVGLLIFTYKIARDLKKERHLPSLSSTDIGQAPVLVQGMRA